MADSPVNLMMYGHTPEYTVKQQIKNKQLKEELARLVVQLNLKKEESHRYLRELDNQEENIANLKVEIREEEIIKQRSREVFNTTNCYSKQFTENNNNSYSSLEFTLKNKALSQSTQLPHKKAYLQSKNNSIQSSFEGQLMQKKLKLDPPLQVKRVTSYGSLYSEKSFSLNKPHFK